MNDPADDTGYSKTPGSARPPHVPPSLDDDPDDELDLRIRRHVGFPPIMLATGILWILAGASYIALFALLRLLDVPFQGSDFWIILGAFFFTKDGIQLMRGKFRDPLMDGVISIGLGIFFMVEGVYRLNTAGGVGGVGALVFGCFFGAVFLIPGVLVLIGRKQYLAWQQEQEA